MKKKTEEALARARLFYSGRVQGVGFRFTAERIALDLGIFGWVRNLPDGRVEILCESRKDKIEEFMKRVGQSLTPYIHKVHCSWEEARGEFDDFRIEFCV